MTAFFRDPGAFDTLASSVIPKVFEARDDGDCIRAWVPGCATGEEAYSIAMLLIEERARRDKHFDIQVFASDLDVGALATAREGRYPTAIEADVSPKRLRRFFVPDRLATPAADLPAWLGWMLLESSRSFLLGQPDLTFPDHTIQPVELAPDPVLRLPVSQG